MSLIVAQKSGPHGLLLVITDKDILGKKNAEGKKRLDLSSPFFLGEEKTSEEIKKAVTRARDVIFTGNEAVALGINLDLIEPKKILYVQKIPHAQVALQ